MTDGRTRGRFVWHELMTPDPKKAQDFYTKVAGWGTQPFRDDYTMWTAGGVTIGGVMALPEPTTPKMWLAYVAVPDVDAAASLAKAKGGAVIKAPVSIPNVGRFSILADPQGALFCVFKGDPGQPLAPDAPSKPGEFSWHELVTRNHRDAWTFYEALFGWTKRSEFDMGPMGMYLIFGNSERDMGGMFDTPAGMATPPHWLHYIHVDSADRAAERVTANGGTVLNGPMDVPGGDRIAQCLDPQGIAFAVHSRKA
jgi:predicted enzyme related to lactoylglutathione lyase